MRAPVKAVEVVQFLHPGQIPDATVHNKTRFGARGDGRAEVIAYESAVLDFAEQVDDQDIASRGAYR